MDDARRSANARAWAERALLVLDEELELAFQDVERIRMLPMDVRTRSRPRAIEVRFRDAELFEGGLDHDPSAEQRLTFAGSVNDPWHRPRV